MIKLSKCLEKITHKKVWIYQKWVAIFIPRSKKILNMIFACSGGFLSLRWCHQCCSDTTTTYNCSFNVSHTSSGLLISKVIDSWFIPNLWAGKILIRKWVNPGIYSSFVCSPDGGPATWVPPLEGQDGRHIVLIFMVYGIRPALCFIRSPVPGTKLLNLYFYSFIYGRPLKPQRPVINICPLPLYDTGFGILWRQ